MTFLVCLLFGCTLLQRQPSPTTAAAEERALQFLMREVPAWSRENGCFSCHNNGDAARALYAALYTNPNVPYAYAHGTPTSFQHMRNRLRASLSDTSDWLSKPDLWDINKGDPGFSDQTLANIQFAAALVDAIEAGVAPTDRQALVKAAARVAPDQAPDGAWHIGPRDTLGSPATYGRPLATYVAAGVLRKAGLPEFALHVRRAEQWLRELQINTVLDASVTLLALHKETTPTTAEKRAAAYDFLSRAQTADGGWGPYVDAPPEAFDTAMVLLALAAYPELSATPAMIARGRSFLVALQNPDGSWPETTRPARGESYAQRMSTTGWATLALLRTTSVTTESPRAAEPQPNR